MQTEEQEQQMDKVIGLIMKYNEIGDELQRFNEISKNEDFTSLSSAGDATHIDFGNGGIITFIVRCKLLDRALPIAWGIKISDCWIPYCRFALHLFLKYVNN